MKALIIAAGRGSRLAGLTQDKPKPLIQLLGLSLIERVILTAKQAGVDDFLYYLDFQMRLFRNNLKVVFRPV